jgi:hypothetical protein
MAMPAQQVSIDLTLISRPGQELPSTLQWEITTSTDQLTLIAEKPIPGPAAQTAGKSVSCRVTSKSGSTETSACMLYGGREPIPNGVVAVMRLSVAPDAQPGRSRIRLDKGLAVMKDLKKIPLKTAETVVTIRRKTAP